MESGGLPPGRAPGAVKWRGGCGGPHTITALRVELFTSILHIGNYFAISQLTLITPV